MLTWLDNLLFCIRWPWPLVIIILALGAAAYVAWKTKHLSISGAVAAFIEGTVILWCLRFEGFIIMLAFYGTSIAIGKYTRKLRGINRGHKARESMSVLANGALACIAALHFYNTGYNGALLMFGAAAAEATSDTWAGEIGRLAKKDPVSIRTFQPVKRGLSGGVTPLGFVSGFVGVVFIGLIWMLCFPIKNLGVSFAIICLTGFAGCVLDSFLGATCQALYEDVQTGELTEKEKSSNGEPNILVRGLVWMDNDAVNFASNFFSAIFALALSAILF